jgi:hypothetical protein
MPQDSEAGFTSSRGATWGAELSPRFLTLVLSSHAYLRA